MLYSRYFLLLIFLSFILFGCSSGYLQKYSLETPAQILKPVGSPTATDGRARFREIFCELLGQAPGFPDEAGGCDDYLTKLSDEPIPHDQSSQLAINHPKPKIFIVPGTLGECIADIAFPFDRAIEQLRPQGYHIEPLMVSGRSSSEYNARQIASVVENLKIEEQDTLILIGHSKGAVDILHFLVDFPQLAKRIDAVVSVAGAINGSPLANQATNKIIGLGSNVSLNNCAPGDGGAFQSLKRSIRLDWLANNPLPTSVKYFSVVSFTNRDRINRWLLSGYDLLKTIDPRNDGLLLFSDQIIPGSVLLGYINADHWEVVLTDKDDSSRLSKLILKHDSFPNEILLEAIIHFITENLGESGSSD